MQVNLLKLGWYLGLDKVKRQDKELVLEGIKKNLCVKYCPWTYDPFRVG